MDQETREAIEKLATARESCHKEHARRIADLEHAKDKDREVYKLMFKSIEKELKGINGTVGDLADRMEAIINKPLKRIEEIKVAVFSGVIVAIVLSIIFNA